METFIQDLRATCLDNIQQQLMHGGNILYTDDVENAILDFESVVENKTCDIALPFILIDEVWNDVTDMMIRIAHRYQYEESPKNMNPIALPVLRIAKILCKFCELHNNESVFGKVDQCNSNMIYACAFYLCDAPYVTSESKELCHSILSIQAKLVLKNTNDTTLNTLFPRYINRILSLFASKSSKEEWVATFSAPPRACRWYLLQLHFPAFSNDILGRVLALVFPLLDEVTLSTQSVGLDILHHVIQNSTPTSVRGYTEVLLHVMEQTLTTASSSPSFLLATLLCLRDILNQVSVQHEVIHYDRFLPKLIRQWDMALEVEVKKAFTIGLRPWIQAMGAPYSTQLVRYLQPLLKVTLGCLESTALQLEALVTLRFILLGCWIRIHAHVEEITVGMIRCLAYQLIERQTNQVKKSSSEAADQITNLCHDILKLCQVSPKENQFVRTILLKVETSCPQLAETCINATHALTNM